MIPNTSFQSARGVEELEREKLLSFYGSILKKYLKGRELSEQFIDYVVRHENKRLRNAFRHYIQ